MAADLAISLATPFIEYLITPIRRQCGYILFYRSYLKELEEGVDKLKDELEGVQHKCEAAKRNAMDIEKKVTKWIDGVNNAVKEADTLLLGEIRLDDGCQSWFKRGISLDLSHQAEQVTYAIQHDSDLRARKRLFYLNPMVCYRKGRKAKKTMLIVQGLNEDKKTLGDISYEDTIVPILSAKDYESLGSRSEIVENIIKALSDAKVSMIGVWGMGGVGKSTLMKEIIRLVRGKNLFDNVAMAVVSQNPDVKKIQGELAIWLGLNFKDDEHVSTRAARLHKRLKSTDKKKSTAEPLETKKQDAIVHDQENQNGMAFQRKKIGKKSTAAPVADHEKQDAVLPEENQDGSWAFQLFQWKKSDSKSTVAPMVDHDEEQDQVHVEPVVEGKPSMKKKQVLIVLDDIWRGLDLEEIGIPLDAEAVKLLFTSRKQHVLSSEMSCSENVFQLEVLKHEEPWKLFESVVGKEVCRDSKFRPIGEQVVEKCSGLPVVLNAIATTLKNCSLPEWEDALVHFKGSKDAYSNLEISYKHLESDEIKSLFLVCALTNSASISVQDLLYYCMGLGLLKGTNTVRSARQKLKALLHNLQDSSLLLKDDIQDPGYVHIHDAVREVAIRIASRDQDSLLITDEFELKEIPRKKLKYCKVVSIPYASFRRLPEGWVCPELRMFLLYRRVDDPLIGIPDSFFEGMKELSVLDISGRCCDSLPSSIQFLLNLNTLCLDRCSIEDLTIVGKLKQLQILTFIGSEVARLPKEIGELSELKVLNLEDSKLKIIEPHVLANLTSLEELHLKGSSYIRWEDEGEMQPSNAKVSELNNLSNLSIINIHIQNPSTIPEHLEFGKLAEYIIQIGDVWDWAGDYKESRMLKIKLELCRGSFLHEKWVQDLLKRTQNLQLDGIKGWQRSINELCLDGFQELKHLHLQNSPLVHCVARSSISNWLPYTAFTVLESLFLEKLPGLEMISRGPIAAKSFSKLKVIKVIDCGKLKSLFSYSMLKCLSQLEEIEVRDCEAMQVIVTVDSAITNTDQVVNLEALHRIELQNLPNFMRFVSSHKLVDVDQTEIKTSSSEIVQDVPCIPTNTMFSSDQQVSFPLLKTLILSRLPKLKYIWQNHYPVHQVVRLEYLEVSCSDDLLVVIPSSLVKEVKKLETLIVRDCGSVQEVFETSDGVTTSDVEILSRLNNLELSNLPFLRHIWGNNHHQTEKGSVFQNLNSLTVVSCNSLMNLLPATLLKSLNQLRKLHIKKCKEMETFVLSVNDNIVLQSLVDVWLEDLPNMVTFVWTKGGESIKFPSLKQLYIEECPKMKSFSLLKEDASAPADQLCFFDEKVLLPVLAGLDLISMKSIQKIWHEEILEQSFCPLEILVVKDCQALVDVIPSINMRVQFDNLKEIIIKGCNSLEGPIFKFSVEETTGKEYSKGHYSLPQLEKLWLFELPKLKHVVQPDSQVLVGFQSLVEISVADCESVIDLFPITTAATLSKLEDLNVLRCRSMTQIFGKDEEEAEEEEDEMLDSILFPCLRSIMLQNLDSLISVFSGISCMLSFPSLEALDISWCSKLKTFFQSDHTSDQTLERSASPFIKESVHYLFDDKVELPNLKKVELYDLSTLQTVWKTRLPCLNICDRIGKITEITIKDCENLEEFIFESDNGEKEIKTTNDPAVFHSLANVTLGNLPNMVAFIRGRRDQIIKFPSLKELQVRNCQKMRAFSLLNTEENGGDESLPLCFFNDKVLLPKLVLLDFISVGSMEKIWHEEIPQQYFCEIEQLLIKDCQNLVNIFPSNNMMVGVGGLPFQNLKKISVNGCTSLEGSLFYFAGGEKRSKGCKLSLPQLETLWLNNLPKLEHVVEPTSHAVCSFPNLVEISMGYNPCVIDLFPISTAPSLSKLQNLEIFRCGSMIQVFGKDKVEEEEEKMMDPPILLFPCIRSIELQNLDNLISFFSVTSSVIHFPSLEALDVSSCPNLKTFVQRYTIDEIEESATIVNEVVHYLFDDKVELPNLKKLELYDLSTLQTVWKTNLRCPSICDRIGQITEININDCENLKEFILESDNGEKEIKTTDRPAVFNSLANVMLGNLPNMVAFVRGRRAQSINFPSLKELQVTSCQKMRAFCLPNTEESGGGQSSLPLCFFDHKVLVPKVVELTLVSVGSIEKIWHEEISEESFLQLESLIVRDCQNLVNVFPSKYVSGTQQGLRFQHLKEIIIRECNSLEGSLFEFARVGEEKGKGLISLPQLEKLWLFDLPKLEHIIHPTADVLFEVQSLVEISVADCECIVDLFQIATAATLSKLEKVQILRCNSMRHVFGKEEAEEQDEMMDLISFPCLRTITVQNLNSLICFFLGTAYQLYFPSLEDLEVSWCLILKTFIHKRANEGIHYFFDDKVQLPNLKKMKLFELSSLQAIWKTQLPGLNSSHGVGKIMEMTIQNCKKLEEIICESDDSDGEFKTVKEPAVLSLVDVRLENLPELVALVKGRRGRSINFPCLKKLYVRTCLKMRAFYLPSTEENGDESLPLCFFDHKVLVPKVVELTLVSVGSIEKIWHEELSEESCFQMESLIVKDCQNLVNVFPSKYVSGTQRLRFQNLKTIIIRECNSLEGSLFEFVRVREEKGKGVISLPQLEKLWLFHLPKLEHVIHSTADVLFEVQSLVEISVADCECIVDIFPIATAATLSKLEKVQILRCSNMRYVFGKEEAEEEEEMVDSISFPCLRSIQVQKLNSLSCFFLGIACQLNFPSLEDLEFSWCLILKTFIHKHANEGIHYFFDDKARDHFLSGLDGQTDGATLANPEVQLPKLKKMKLFEISSLQAIWKTQLPCLSSSHGVGKIREITIQNCKKVEEIICESDDSDGEFKTVKEPAMLSLVDVRLENLPELVALVKGRRGRSINFPYLKKLYVRTCLKMRAFYLPSTEENGDESLPLCFFDHKVLVPKVVELTLVSVGSVEKIWHEEKSEESCFQLESLIVKDCQNLVNVFPSKYVSGTQQGLRFQNLKKIIIRECNSVEGSLFGFVWEGEEKRKGLISLPQLEKLWLLNLPKPEHVIHPTSDVLVEFQGLVEISVADCECIVDLLPIATAATLSKLEKVQILRCNSMRHVFGTKEEAEEKDEILVDSISFPCLRFIQVQKLNSLICFFLGTACQLDFPLLEDLEISWCPVLKTFVQRHKSEDVHYLFDDKVKFPNLQKMKLLQLSSLQTVWKNELLPSSDSCTRLKSLTVSQCKELQHILPASFASNLARLEELCINSSVALEEIVVHGDDYGSSEELDVINSSELLFFTQLMNLELYDLPNLRSFFRGSNASTWSALKKLWMWHCDKMQIFTTKFSSSNNEKSNTRISLFSAEQVIPKLEILRLVEEDFIMIQDGEFKKDIFTELKHFSLACFHNAGAAAFPSRFLLENNFQKLERLNVYCSSFEEIFPDESLSPQEIISYKERLTFAGEGNELKPLARLREVKLSKLHNLKHVWKADMTVFAEILKNIQVLEVMSCPKLKNLFPTASCCFGNITTIKVERCNGMQELVTTSAATSLVKLAHLDIYDCGMIETIVSADEVKRAEGDGELVITFRDLKHLRLHHLPSLTSFSSANCTFELPSLEEVIVIKCPNLMVFSSNSVVAPKLSKVLLTEKEEVGKVRWDGDLNTTIQNLPK